MSFRTLQALGDVAASISLITVQPVTAVLQPVKVRSRRPPRVPCSNARLAGGVTFPRESSGTKFSAAGEQCLSGSDRSGRASNHAGGSKANTEKRRKTIPTEADVGGGGADSMVMGGRPGEQGLSGDMDLLLLPA